MSKVLNRENLDLIALQLDQTTLVEQVTGLELLQNFVSVDGFWHACVEMVTPTSAQLKGLLKNSQETGDWANGSMEQVIEIGIRDQVGNLTASFCDWFEIYCGFVEKAGIRNFLLPHMRPAEFADLGHESTGSLERHETKSTRPQLQTKFTNSVIEHMNIAANASASELYPDFAQKAVELADNQLWGQDLTVEIEMGTGILLISYTTTGSAARVIKKVTPRRFSALLSQSLNQAS